MEVGQDHPGPIGDMLSFADPHPIRIFGASNNWRGGRVAEGNGLLNRHTGDSLYREFESLPLR